MRRFMGGAIWGAIVGVLGLGVVSQMAPVPGSVAEVAPVAGADAPAVQDVTPAIVADEAAPVVAETAEAAPIVADVEPPQGAVPEATDAGAPAMIGAAQSADAGMPVAQPVADAAPGVTEAPAQPPAPPPTEAPLAQSAPDVAVAVAPTAPGADAPVATATVTAPVIPSTDAAPEGADLPPPPPLTAEEQALLDAVVAGAEPVTPPLAPVENPIVPLPDAPVAEAAPAPLPETAPDAIVVVEPAPEAETLAPAPTFAPVGVIADDTPSTLVPTPPLISGGSAALPEPAASDAAAVPDVTDPDAPPLERYAAAFDNPDARPIFSIVLFDTGAADLDRAMLANLPFAVSFVVDPLTPGAAEAATLYRAGGKEVLMLASGIPDGATPADLEQTFQAHAAVLPEAVAVIDQADAGFQNDRQLSTQLVPILAAQGRGLLTWDRGLNAADQVARREALPTAMVFRSLDAEGEETPVIRRYLDRAAFKAAQEGAVTVVGQARPETVAALLEWAVEGRSATVALAPVSAVLAGR